MPETVSEFEQDMNPEQVEVIRHTDGPCAVMATAGSGKTRALVHRVARMVADGVDPKRILAVTFSKMAADEMNKRLVKLCVDGARVGTWHSLCLEILRRDETPWGSWKIDDGGRFPMLIKEVLGFKHMKWKDADPKAVGRYIGLCKANLEFPGSPQAMARARGDSSENGVIFEGTGDLRLHEAYYIVQSLARNEGLLPFDDFLMFAYQHLAGSGEARERWASRWSFLLQDEVQDSNMAQMAIAFLLAKDHRNYMVVGDPAQSIYKFRGSDPSFLMNFAKDWNAKTILMNRNYRSGSLIIDAANRVIAPAEIRLPKEMIAERGTEGDVRIVSYEAEEDQARELTCWVQQLIATEGAKPGDIAVIYRMNAQSRAPEEALLRARVPYKILGGVSFYDRREVKNLLAYLRVAVGRGVEDDVKRCINAPFRFLGNAFVDRVLRTSNAAKARAFQDAERETQETGREIAQKPLDWTDVVLEVADQDGVQNRQAQSAEVWASLINNLGTMRDQRVSNTLNWLVEKTRYIDFLKQDEGKEDTENSHIENVRELIRVAHEFNSIDKLLAYVEEMTNLAKKNRSDKKPAPVVLMSIHKIKGLEYPYVFVAGVNKGVLPHIRGDREEERRLMYVAVTRARDKLVVGCAPDKNGDYSPFIRDISALRLAPADCEDSSMEKDSLFET